jgi:histidyl-tRNA synthetase
MSKQSLRPPSGTRDFLPDEQFHRNETFVKVRDCFESFGFVPFDTPAFERLEMLQGKYGEEGEKLIFKILKRGDKAASGESDYALRYDLTVPTMRCYAANHHKFPKIFKRYQIGPVWRADRPGKGRFREFYQCDVDIFGAKSLEADIYVMTVLTTTLKQLGLEAFTLKLNSRKILRGMMEAYNIADNHQKQVLIALDKCDKIGIDGVLNELSQIGLSEKTMNRLRDGLSSDDFASRLPQLFVNSDIGREGLNEVEVIMKGLGNSLNDEQLSFDPILARGLDYYTGPIFEIVGRNFKGSIASGGRYDGLAEAIGGVAAPVTGGSLGLERILMLLEEESSDRDFGPDVYFTVWDQSFFAETMEMAATLRAKGLKVDVDLTGQKMGKQMAFASSIKAKKVVIYGPDEKAKGEVVVKDMRAQSQELIKIADLLSFLNK